MRVVFAVLCIAGAVAAQGREQIAWVDSLDRALEEAKTTGKPVMVCINAKEGESANKHAALAAARFKGTASKLVLKKLEKAVVSKKASDFLRAGLVYSLGRIGNTSSTVKALRKAYERARQSRARPDPPCHRPHPGQRRRGARGAEPRLLGGPRRRRPRRLR